MRFESVLFPDGRQLPSGIEEPAYFGNLNLDRVTESISASRERYELARFFHHPLHDPAPVRYRQAACRDVEKDRVRKAVDGFAEGMVVVRRHLTRAANLRHHHHRNRWIREAAHVYSDAVAGLADELANTEVESEALRSFRDYLAEYAASEAFRAMTDRGRVLDEELAEIRYTIQIKGDRVTVRRHGGGDDYRPDVEATFSRFEQGEAKDRRIEYPTHSDLNPVEARILDLVAELFPEPFNALDEYCTQHGDFIDRRIARFDREVQFYLSWLDYISAMRGAGLEFCYPELSTSSKEVDVVGSFDVALAGKLVGRGETVVPNDFTLTGPERILVVTGPNQGGKTTFARMFGQIHHLAALGLPVPGRSAKLSLPDQIFTHFAHQERIETLRGRLEEELFEVHEMLEQATPNSIFVVNEGFSSTTVSDAVFLGSEVVGRIVGKDMVGVYVTFVDELASLSEATVSMVAAVEPDDPTKRTLLILRRPANGLAHAVAIAAKYGVSHDRLRERISR
jgi:DNA mismatch repair protein MutS